MKYKLLRQRLSISAPRMRIRTYWPWYVRVMFWIFVGIVIYLSGRWIYESGLTFAGHQTLIKQVENLREQVHTLTEERNILTSQANAAESRLQMEKSTQTQLGQQVQLLTAENNRLKEELGFYLAIDPNDQKVGIAIRSARITREIVPDQWRYRVLLTQTGKTQQNFNGQLQLVLSLQQKDKSAMLILPESNAVNNRQYQVNFRRFHKIEGVFNTPPEMALKAVQIRVLEHNEVRAQQDVFP